MSDMHPAGDDFLATVMDHGYRTSKVKGTVSLQIMFQTDQGTVYGDLWFNNDDNAERSIEKLRILGWEGTDLSELNNGSVLRGNKCRISVEHDTYDGKTRAKVGWINPLDWQPGLSHDDEAAIKVKLFNKFAKTIKKPEDKIPF